MITTVCYSGINRSRIIAEYLQEKGFKTQYISFRCLQNKWQDMDTTFIILEADAIRWAKQNKELDKKSVYIEIPDWFDYSVKSEREECIRRFLEEEI